MTIPPITPIQVLTGLSVCVWLQPPILAPDWLNAAEHLTLDTALVLAVIVLWRSLEAERKRTLANVVEERERDVQVTKSVTQALVAATDSNRELRIIITESVEAKQRLTVAADRETDAIERLSVAIGRLPCTTDTQMTSHSTHK